MAVNSNNPPDVVLELTHEQATFLLESGAANIRLGFAMVMSMADEDVPIEVKAAKSAIIENMRRQFSEINRLLLNEGWSQREGRLT